MRTLKKEDFQTGPWLMLQHECSNAARLTGSGRVAVTDYFLSQDEEEALLHNQSTSAHQFRMASQSSCWCTRSQTIKCWGCSNIWFDHMHTGLYGPADKYDAQLNQS